MLNAFGLARIGRDAEIRYTPNGDAVCNLSLAFAIGGKERATQWIDASIWGKRAEALAPYLLKGTAVAVALQDVHIEAFQKADGSDATKLVARVADLDLAGASGAGGTAPARAAAPAPAPAPRPAPRPAPAQTGSGFDSMDDDIPF